MMGELEILSPLHLRFTVNNWENVLYGFTKFSFFQFNGGKYKLKYYYDYHHTYEVDCHSLSLWKEFGNCRHQIDASVQVESGGRGRIVTDLSGHKHLFNVTRTFVKIIWQRDELEIRQAVPNFRNQALTWIIVLKEVNHPQAALACQTKCSILEDFEMSCMESLSADFAQLMTRGSDHDITFMCSGQSIEAHGAVVCARSPVIAAMLRSDMLEGRTKVITIPDVELNVFKHFLRYLYCGKLVELTYDAALTLYELGDQYSVLGLVKRCSQFLLEHLSPDNAYDVLAIADLHSDEDFVEKIITHMVEATVPHVSDRWPAFRENHPQLALKVLREEELVQEKKRRCRKRKFSFAGKKYAFKK